MRAEMRIISLLTVLACLSLLAQQTPRRASGGLAERFKQLDRNGDGKLTRDEFPAAKIFDAADANKDGFLTLQELQAYFQKQGAAPASPPPASTPAPAPTTNVDLVEVLNVPYASVPGVDPNLLSLDIHAPKGAKAAPVVIYDLAHPVPAGEKLTGCRDIEPSPFAGEQGRVFYFCGYDGGAGPSHNAAWIYRADIPQNNNSTNKP